MSGRDRQTAVAAALVVALTACSGGAVAGPEVVRTSTTTPPEVTGSTSTVPPGAEDVALVVDGSPRTYRRYVPPNLPGDVPAALVIDLHGFTSTPGRQDSLSGWSAVARDEGFVVAQPAAGGGIASWDPTPSTADAAEDLALIRAVVDDVASVVPVEPGRIFVSGFSNGAGMANRIACDAADLVAAIGTVAGAYVDPNRCGPVEPVAVISFHGTDDIVIPYEGAGAVFPPIGAWAAGWAERNECAPVPERSQVSADTVAEIWGSCEAGADVTLYTVQGGSHSWPGSQSPGLFEGTDTLDATRLMWAFFASHER